MTSPSFTKMATVTASTKRTGTISSGGKRVAATTNIASLKCLPLDPMSNRDMQTIRRTNTNTPFDLLVTFWWLPVRNIRSSPPAITNGLARHISS
jgi:hypothetical protein